MKKKINFEGVSPEVWARTIILFIALVNQVLAIFGKGQIDIAESDVYQICSIIATLVSAIWAWWKNNSFSISAQGGDNTMHAIEAQQAQGELEYEAKPIPEHNHSHDDVVGRG